MYKQFIAILFSIAFLSVIIVPTVCIIVDDTFDTSIVVSISEEEENGSEKNLSKDFLPSILDENYVNYDDASYDNNLQYCNKTYNTPHLNIISPPPDYTYL